MDQFLHNWSNLIKITYSLQLSNSLSGLVFLCNGQSASSAENNQIEQRVGTQTVGAVDRRAAGFASSVQARDDGVLSVLVLQHLRQKNY
jgi:hypothetical protein